MGAPFATAGAACLCLLALGLLVLVGSHRSLPPGVTCGSQFNSSGTALEIPEPTISWASYRIITCDAPIFWLKAQVAAAGQNLSFTSSVPAISRFDPVRISTLVIGPGLPALSAADEAKVPAAALADIQTGEGAVLFESPSDQSTCAHLQSREMSETSTVWNGRCDFHEPYGDSHMWVVHDERLVAAAPGEHRFAVFDAGSHTAKVAFACCDWPEDFTTPYPMPDADCPYCGTKASFGQHSSLFFEKDSMAEYSGFPASQDCSSDPSPPAPPAQCPDETPAGSGDVAQPESCMLGCASGECHSHNIFGECTYELEWVIPTPKIGGTNVTSLVIFKGDTVKFARKGNQWPHNLIEMASETALEDCDVATSTQILTVEEVTVGTDVQFSTEGTFYYSCSMTGHCAAGQKLTVQVKDSSEGMRCHDHHSSSSSGGGSSSSSSDLSMTCASGEVKAYILGDAGYGAQSDQCSELCTTSSGLAWMPTASEGSCACAGFPMVVEKKSVQPGGSPMAMDVLIFANSTGVVSSTCHCHSYEEIKCDASGDALYDEHIVEIQNYCQGIVDGTEDACPYKCFQPFEVLHLHYLQCDLRPKHSLYKQIKATDKCHLAARAPYGTECEMVEEEPTQEESTQNESTQNESTQDESTDPQNVANGAGGSAVFGRQGLLVIMAITVAGHAIFGGLAA